MAEFLTCISETIDFFDFLGIIESRKSGGALWLN
nr:MAG TPA: hypothetical protein [Caudoviricetes sp.]